MMNFENLDRVIFDGVGRFNIPPIACVEEYNADRFGRLIYWNKEKTPENTCLHCFSYDYQFMSVWTRPEQWIPRLKRFKCVVAPDFSLYYNMPQALALYNHYRKHWVSAYWAREGITVIPTIRWTDRDSYDWCFDGEPKNSVIAISSVGVMKKEGDLKIFMEGYREMLERLTPKKIIWYGRVPEGVTEDIIKVDYHFDQWKKENKDYGH